ncbi:MAG TPA: divalent-cation tolerance protein CutA [Candidatus Dormibacteraeota bacterium]
MSDTSPVLVIATFATRDEAERVGEALVEQRLAACGNVIPTIHSFYYWEGKLQRELEALLLLKSTRVHVAAIADYIQREGNAEMPEVVSVPVEGGLSGYLEWVAGQVDSKGPRS